MPDRTAYDPELFAGAASWYRRYRTPYPEAMSDFLAAEFALKGARVLDLGCGTGQIAIPLAARGARVVAMDPDAVMLAEGRAAAAEAGVSGIEWIQSSSWGLEAWIGTFRLVTVGIAFHWMDRAATIAALDPLVEGDGAVALIAEQHRFDPLMDSYGRAQAAITEVVAEFLGPARRAGSGMYGEPVERHEDVLVRSAFSSVSFHLFPAYRVWTADQLVGLALSSSSSTPALLGDNTAAFIAAAHERLLTVNTEGEFEEIAQIEVVIGRRP
jgi:SAM-dependent methyltransferase